MKIKNGHVPLLYDDEAKKYIELRFAQHTTDYDSDVRESEVSYKAKECDEEDFSSSERYKEIFRLN